MKMFITWIAPILLLIGTAGLLMNEYILGWGRSATITFAVFNLVGLALLIPSILKNRKSIVNKNNQ
jgi:hypothetical protein